MKTVSTLATNAVVGETILSVGNRELGSKIVAIKEAPVGMRVSGPRGGHYRLTAAGARAYVVFVLANGKSPLIPKTATIRVLRAAE